MKKFAPLWKRIIAYLFDSLIIGVIIIKPLIPTTTQQNFLDFLASLLNKDFWLSTFFILILTLAYWTFLEWKFGQSIGKILLQLKVVTESEKEITLTQALLRNLSKLSSIILLLDTIYLIIGKGYQRFFENISKTKVIEVIDNE